MSANLDQQPNTKPPEPKKQRGSIARILHSRKLGVALAIGIILFLAVYSFFLPPEGESNNVTGDVVNATVTVTGLVETLIVKRSVDFNHVHITVTKVEEATKFSDDRKRGGNYIVRIHMQEKTSSSTPIGIDYATIAHLLLPNGQALTPKLVGLSPAVLPNQLQEGFIDFPLATSIPLSSLTLRLGSETNVAFGKS